MFLILLGDPGASDEEVEALSDFFLPGVALTIPGSFPLPELFLGPKMAALSFTFTSSSPLLEEVVAGKLLGRRF